MLDEQGGSLRARQKAEHWTGQVRRVNLCEFRFHFRCNWEVLVQVEVLDVQFDLVEDGRS